jgi:hypothetical protein
MPLSPHLPLLVERAFGEMAAPVLRWLSNLAKLAIRDCAGRGKRMRFTPQTDARTVVLVGNFSPKMFHPLWFEARKLIGKQEAEDARVGVVHEEITKFSTGKLDIEIQQERFVVASTILPDAPRDLLLDLFGQHLPGTPLRALGINRTVHFDVGSSYARDEIGKKLAPREPWGEWGDQITASDGTDERGGLLSLKMQQTRLGGEPPGYVGVRIEPSGQIKNSGIFMEINGHYRLAANPPEAADASEIVKVLAEQWEAANACAERIIGQIMSLAPSEEP